MPIKINTKLKKWINSENSWLFFFFFLVFLIRLPVVNVSVLDWDESVYWTIAQDIANGGVPYKTSWDHKGPFLFFIFVPVIYFFDNSIIALRIFTTLYLILSMYFLFLVARKLFHNFVSLIPPLIYGLFFIIPNFQGFSSNGELFMMLPVILSIYFYLEFKRKESVLPLFFSGSFASIAFFIKGTSIFSFIVIPIFLLYKSLGYKSGSLKPFVKKVVYFSLGFSTPFLLLNIYFLANRALYDFYYAFFIANSRYVKIITAKQGLINSYRFIHKTVLINYEIITLISLASSIYLIIKLIKSRLSSEQKNKIYFFLILSILSAVGVLCGKRMYPHYYLQMALPLSFLIALAISELKLNQTNIKIIMILVLLIYAVQSPLQKVLSYRDKVNLKKSDQYRSDQIESFELAKYIKSKTTDNEKILVLGGQPIVYFLSERKSPIKIFWWNDNQLITLRKSTNFEGTLPQALNINKPAYIIYYDGKDGRQRLRFDYFGKFINHNYSFEKRISNYKLYRINQ